VSTTSNAINPDRQKRRFDMLCAPVNGIHCVAPDFRQSMHISIRSIAFGVILAVLAVTQAFAKDIRLIEFGAGHGPQWAGNTIKQRNSVIDVNFFFKKYHLPWLGRSIILLGMGYSSVWTDADIHQDSQVVSLIPAYRYYFDISDKIQMFIHIAAGPSIMSSRDLGYQRQGSKFIFNDSFGLGIRFGQSKKWELSLVWRHLSNADLFKPNDGFDVPITLILGRVF
jgi:lipid A 3-O-deacylase